MYALSNAFFKFLGKSAGVQTERDHDQALQDFWQEKGSRHLSYLFQHTKLTHEDGPLSLNEMLTHGETARKIRTMHRECHENLSYVNLAGIPAPLRGRRNTISFLIPLAHVICDSNKSRSMIGFLTVDNFSPGKIPEPDTWFKPADFAMMKA